MIFELPLVIITLLNCAVLPAIQLGCAWGFTRLPAGWFAGEVKCRSGGGGSYFLIRKWKRWIPDGASWFRGGFPKRSLESMYPGYLRAFAVETWRGEACHWTAMALCCIPFLWNPWWGCAVIAAYALFANVPCILIQRHNRHRLGKVMAHSRALAKSARS